MITSAQKLLMARAGVGTSGVTLTDFSNTYTANTTGVSSKTVDTFNNVSLGAADPERVIYVAVMAGARLASAPTVTNVLVAGETASKVISANHRGLDYVFEASIWQIPLSSGTSGNIVIYYPSTQNAVGAAISVYSAVGRSVISSASDTASSLTLDLNTLSGGAVIACAATQNGSSMSWTGVAPDINVDTNTGEWMSSGSLYPSSTNTPLAISPSATGLSVAGVSICIA